MVETQIDTVNEIDDKAATTMRVLALIVGALLSIFIFFGGEQSSIAFSSTTLIPILWVGIGIVGLLASFAFCIHTYLSSRMLFGPKAVLGEVLSSHRVGSEDYQNVLLRGFATAIDTNKEVIRVNSRRFKRALLAFWIGVVGLGSGFGFLVFELAMSVDVLLSVPVVVVIGYYANYIIREKYMIVPHEG
ncbi:hypothetical protein EXE46_14780 [Halorubrum sp. GN11_10-6_MGM]|uniref:hypothetical protein n=1 Tax=Halorubrum sp. GN11_10-6_MGM TaxID=2518112 RepID=UPI0010F61655|nr:hypothetical protein [Halorubrum sp. GN11_10-6_MGM]TKX73114.1 hypothetical protein EXE46_14780 [Halorubrum sp. GN11_10-6_MGM]